MIQFFQCPFSFFFLLCNSVKKKQKLKGKKKQIKNVCKYWFIWFLLQWIVTKAVEKESKHFCLVQEKSCQMNKVLLLEKSVKTICIKKLTTYSIVISCFEY